MTTLANSIRGAAASSDRNFAETLGQLAIIALICLSVTTPGIYFSEDLPWMKAEQLLLPIVVAVYVLLALGGYLRTIRFNLMMAAGVAFSVSMLLSMWYGSAVLGHPLLLRDFYEIPKLWYPVVFFSLAYEADLSEAALRRVFAWFCIAMMLVCLYAWAQWFGLGLSFKLNPYFTGGEHIDGGLFRYRRVYSTMGNPNVLGQLLTWAIVAFLMAAIARIGRRTVYLGAALVCSITLAMTGSRYGLMTLLVGIFLIVVMSSTSRRRSIQLVAAILLLPLFYWTFSVIATSDRYSTERYGSLSNPLQMDSLRERLDVLWRDAEEDIARSPLFGHGPAKSAYTGVITDSEYLDVLKEFGIIGFLPYLAYYLIPAIMIWRGLRERSSSRDILDVWFPASTITAHLALVMIITALIMNIGEDTFHNQELQGLLWIWLGLGARASLSLAAASKRITAVSRSRPILATAHRGNAGEFAAQS